MSHERGDKYAKTYKGSEPAFTGNAYMGSREFVLCKSKRSLSVAFVDQGDEECKGDLEHTRTGGSPNARSEML